MSCIHGSLLIGPPSVGTGAGRQEHGHILTGADFRTFEGCKVKEFSKVPMAFLKEHLLEIERKIEELIEWIHFIQ